MQRVYVYARVCVCACMTHVHACTRVYIYTYSKEYSGRNVPVLLEVVLPLEGLSADLTGEGHVVLMAALVDHEVVGLREAPLAVLADELYRALGAHLLPAAELPAVPLCLHRHYREHPYKFPPLLLLVDSLSPFPLPPLSRSC